MVTTMVKKKTLEQKIKKESLLVQIIAEYDRKINKLDLRLKQVEREVGIREVANNKYKMKTKQKGFAGIVALIVVVVAIIVGGAYVMVKQNTQAPASATKTKLLF